MSIKKTPVLPTGAGTAKTGAQPADDEFICYTQFWQGGCGPACRGFSREVGA